MSEERSQADGTGMSGSQKPVSNRPGYFGMASILLRSTAESMG